jgi:hypothetical protein
MWTVVHIGVLQSMLALHSEALQSYQRALGIAEPAGDAGAVCTILALRAANEFNRDDAESALASASKAAEIASRLEMYDVLANAKVTAGKARRKSGQLPEAIASLQDAVTALERVPVGPGVETFFDDRRSPYLALIDLLVTEKEAPASRLADAFQLWERARTRSLATMLGGDGAVVVKDMTQAERDEERQFARAVKSIGVRLKRERGRSHCGAGEGPGASAGRSRGVPPEAVRGASRPSGPQGPGGGCGRGRRGPGADRARGARHLRRHRTEDTRLRHFGRQQPRDDGTSDQRRDGGRQGQRPGSKGHPLP